LLFGTSDVLFEKLTFILMIVFLIAVKFLNIFPN